MDNDRGVDNIMDVDNGHVSTNKETIVIKQYSMKGSTYSYRSRDACLLPSSSAWTNTSIDITTNLK